MFCKLESTYSYGSMLLLLLLLIYRVIQLTFYNRTKFVYGCLLLLLLLSINSVILLTFNSIYRVIQLTKANVCAFLLVLNVYVSLNRIKYLGIVFAVEKVTFFH